MLRSFYWLFLLFFIGCKSQQKINSPSPVSSTIIDGKLWSSLFQQRAAEYKALCLQAYALARVRVDEAVLQKSNKPKALITDIDETFLDNSPYAVHQALRGKEYEPASWYEWTAKAIADTLYGALGFFNYAAAQKVEIFYVTNREETERKATLQNLQRFQFPYADNEHLILRQQESSKETRRNKIAATHEIILLMGDNLADFSAAFDKKTIAERDAALAELSSEFGKKFIVLPNANYGSWEEAIFQNNRNWTLQQKDSLIKIALKDYK